MQYDIKNNSLRIQLGEDTGFDTDYMGTLTGNTYITLNGTISVGLPGEVGVSFFYVEGYDQDGNPVGAPDISENAIEPLSVSQVPLPGAVGFFVSGLAWLGIIRRKKID